MDALARARTDLEWKVIYVGSASDGKYDQELDSILVGPIPVGVNKFVFKAKAADASKIPQKDLLGVTVVMVTCFYKNQEFIRIGYAAFVRSRRDPIRYDHLNLFYVYIYNDVTQLLREQ